MTTEPIRYDLSVASPMTLIRLFAQRHGLVFDEACIVEEATLPWAGLFDGLPPSPRELFDLTGIDVTLAVARCDSPNEDWDVLLWVPKGHVLGADRMCFDQLDGNFLFRGWTVQDWEDHRQVLNASAVEKLIRAEPVDFNDVM